MKKICFKVKLTCNLISISSFQKKSNGILIKFFQILLVFYICFNICAILFKSNKLDYGIALKKKLNLIFKNGKID